MRRSTRILAITLVGTPAFARVLPVHSGATPFSFDSAPGRLPKNVIPIDYAIAIAPDAQKRTLTGTETILLEFREATGTIVFNSLNQTLKGVRVDGKAVAGVVSDDKAQLTTVTLRHPATKGRHVLTFAYRARIETGPVGLFVQPFDTPDGKHDLLLSTQFEATDARRMFPCWDEPAFRATFTLTATVPAAWDTLSNMPVARRVVQGRLAKTTFGRTPKMPTYLVEFTAGTLGSLSADAGGVRLGVWTVRGQEQGGAVALANAQQILADYNDYFGVRFPLPKLDSIAIPGGFGGAMENWGAITYNDQTLLVTPSSTLNNRQTVFSIQAHEMAHQWNGDLVTMGWWDDLWLNESFASWRAAKETDLRHPEWKWWEREDGSKEDAMSADALLNSHAIEQHVTNELEATSAFDPQITYSKGQAVLRMFEAYLGDDRFRDGVRLFMKTHAYSNATSADLWTSLGIASGSDVGAIAGAWTGQPGFPLVSVAARCDAAGARTIALSQRRFLLRGDDQDGLQWQVPLQMRVGTQSTTRSVLLTQNGQSEAAGRCDEPLTLNAGAVGFYRVAYDEATLAVDTRLFATLPSADRIALLDDAWALVQSGSQSLPVYLALVAAMGTDLDERAWTQITDALETIEQELRATPGHEAFTTYARSLLEPLAAKLGRDAQTDESPGTRRLRRITLSDLGLWGDAATVAYARERFAAFVADRSTIAADDQSFILSIVARHADAATFEQLHAVARSAQNETELVRDLHALMRVGDPQLASDAGRIALSPEIPPQASRIRLDLIMELAELHPALAWQVLGDHYESLMAPLQPFGGMMTAQFVPVAFWNALPPESLEAWVRSHVPADLAPSVARGMETVYFKRSEQQALVKSTDAFLADGALAHPGTFSQRP